MPHPGDPISYRGADILNNNSYPGLMPRIREDLAVSQNQFNGLCELQKNGMLRRAFRKETKPHVCIIGAGIAGLRCADILLQHDVQVTIFEARNRIGGRLYQEKVGGHLIDLGPNWIHGTKENPILDLVRQTNTLTHSWGERQVTFDPYGHVILEEDVAEASEILWDIIGDAFRHSHNHSTEIPATESLMDFLKQNIDQRKLDLKQKDLLLQLSKEWGPFIGGTTEEQSLKFLWLEETLEGENLFCAGTYQKVLDLVSKSALEGARIVFEKKVTNIKSAETDERNPVVTVEFADGDTESFDEVVVTAPLGWLKRNQNAFEPALPKRISEAIIELGYGNLDKGRQFHVYISFPEAFWEPSTPSQTSPTTNIPIASCQSSVPNTTAKTQPLHHPERNGTVIKEVPNYLSVRTSTVSSKEYSTSINALLETSATHYPGFTHFVSPTYAQSTNFGQWSQECLNLFALPGPCAHPTLLFYISGPTTTHISKLLLSNGHKPGTPHSPAIKTALLEFFMPYIRLLPNYSDQEERCQPNDVLATAWETDELAGYGSYTNIPTGITRADEDVRALREGVGLKERGVWLSGEHTAPFVALGTVTGAWWAGEAVGRKIVEVYGAESVRQDWTVKE